MTRTVTYLLLLANAGVVLWQLTLGDARGEQPAERDAGVRMLLLLEEARETDSGDGETVTTRVASQPAGGICFTLGPFRSQDGAAQARAELQDLRLKPTGRVRNEREQYGFQVYLPPFESRDAAIEAARELTEKGITEYYIMNENNLLNAVSLGLFRNKSHAERQLERLREMDIFAEMLPRYRDRKLYWLDYKDQEQALSTAAIRQLFPDDPVQRLARSCG